MFNKFEARTVSGQLLAFPLDDISNGFSVQDIEGLDPVKANLVSSSFARLDGEQYQSARREKRNLVFKVGLEPDYVSQTTKALRSTLYTYFMPKSQVNLRFYGAGDPTVDIVGIVESFDCPLFVKDPVATMSVICYNPDFYNPTAVVLNGNTTSSTANTTVTYGGNVDTGMLITVNVNRVMTGFTVVNQAPGGTPTKLDFVATLQAGDVVRISTQSGDKYATLTRTSVQSSILYGVSPYADWVRFQPGTNLFRIDATGLAVPYTVTYTDKYGGL